MPPVEPVPEDAADDVPEDAPDAAWKDASEDAGSLEAELTSHEETL